ncbi:MAG: DUF3168 domain-containing protein [Rhodocyclaceae bacterium]|nr:MAG: DUF3168 domain-containing protein [Rhodocyclaceae bacterium]
MQDFYDAIKHLAAGEVYAVIAPPSAQYPLIVYTPVDQAPIMALDGPNALKRARVQVDVYARTLHAGEQLQDQVLQALLADINTVADVRMGLTDFDEEARIYRVSVDYTYYRQV